MTALRLEGKPVVQELRGRLRAEVAALADAGKPQPTLAVVLVEGDAASERYVRSIAKQCEQVGMGFRLECLAADSHQVTLEQTVAGLSRESTVHGVLIQMPLPAGLSASDTVRHLDYRKDVDGIHPISAGLLAQGTPHLVPNTPAGGIELLRYYGIDVAGKRAAIVGRSNVVGKPMAALLLARNATITICHQQTRDLRAIIQRCEIVIAAAGRPGLITGDMLRPGAVVVDFGINVQPDGSIVGDVDQATAAEVASAFTPVPGGTGPVTNMLLLQNVLVAYREQIHERGTRNDERGNHQ